MRNFYQFKRSDNSFVEVISWIYCFSEALESIESFFSKSTLRYIYVIVCVCVFIIFIDYIWLIGIIHLFKRIERNLFYDISELFRFKMKSFLYEIELLTDSNLEFPNSAVLVFTEFFLNIWFSNENGIGSATATALPNYILLSKKLSVCFLLQIIETEPFFSNALICFVAFNFKSAQIKQWLTY